MVHRGIILLDQGLLDLKSAFNASPPMIDNPRVLQTELRRIVHDLGSPLSAIRVLVEVLRLTEDDLQKKAELLDMMESQVAEMAIGLEALVQYLTPLEGGGPR